MTLEFISEGTDTERENGFSRMAIVNGIIHTAGTTAGGGGFEGGTAYEQASDVFRRLIPMIESAGGSAQTVYRCRVFVTNIDDSYSVLRSMREALGGTAPCATIVEAKLGRPGALCEIELEAAVID
jgi:enamine deaminase RidA (YjgF/YER057c/UK114 family)